MQIRRMVAPVNHAAALAMTSDLQAAGCPPVRGPQGLGVPNERFLFDGVKGQVFVAGVVDRLS